MMEGNAPIRITGPWSSQEDRRLRELVAIHGRNWPLISNFIRGRTSDSCRMRWSRYLSPGMDDRPFTPNEERIITSAVARIGNRWEEIARLLPGRTEAAVSNHWRLVLRRREAAAAAAAAAATATAVAPASPSTSLVLSLPGSSCDEPYGYKKQAEDTSSIGPQFWEKMREILRDEIKKINLEEIRKTIREEMKKFLSELGLLPPWRRSPPQSPPPPSPPPQDS